MVRTEYTLRSDENILFMHTAVIRKSNFTPTAQFPPPVSIIIRIVMPHTFLCHTIYDRHRSLENTCIGLLSLITGTLFLGSDAPRLYDVYSVHKYLYCMCQTLMPSYDGHSNISSV